MFRFNLKSFVLPVAIVSALSFAAFDIVPVSATSFGLGKNPTQLRAPAPAELSVAQMVARALAATCVRFPKGQGLAEAVAPGAPLSLPRLTPKATYKLSSVAGSVGWRLPKTLGVGVLILRPGGSCSILMQNLAPAGVDAAIKEVFEMIPQINLKSLESNSCIVAGQPMKTRVYAMIPVNDVNNWGKPEVADGKTTWRGFLLSVAMRGDEFKRHQVVMTTFVGRHEVGAGCADLAQ